METTQFHRPPPVLQKGTEIAGRRYRLLEVLGAGGMGTVYLCSQANPNRKVVIKFPHPDLMRQVGFRERFEAEIQFMIALDHPGVVSIYETGDHQGLPFAVMQYLAGGSLADRLKKGGRPQTVDTVSQWLLPISKTLDSIHADGVLHRDIKPDNILFDHRGHPYLSDFGISKAISETAAAPSALTQTGMLIGSPRYLPPEYIDRKFGPAGDQYSLASTVYFSVTSRPPHEATTNERLLVAKATVIPKLASEFSDRISVESAAALATALSISPEGRFATCEEFASQFARSNSHSNARDTRNATEVIKAPARSKRWLAVAGFLAALAGAAATLWSIDFPAWRETPIVEEAPVVEQEQAQPGNTEVPERAVAGSPSPPTTRASTPALTSLERPVQASPEEPVKEASPPPPPPKPGFLFIRSAVRADRVFIDDEVQNGIKKGPIELSAGEHEIRIEKEGYLPFSRTVAIAPGNDESLRVVLKLTPEETAKREEAERLRLAALAEEAEREAARIETERQLAVQAELEREKRIERERIERLGMVAIPEGEFFYGCNGRVDKDCEADEQPGAKRSLPAFAIDRTEVTVAAFGRCVDAAACSDIGLTKPYYGGRNQPAFAETCNWAKPSRENHPINCVSWDQASAYCKWKGGRLPSQAEWEKAARGTDGRKYPWGNRGFGSAKEVANIADAAAKQAQPDWTWSASGYNDGYYATAPVATYPNGASPYGALDMIGNVWEWTSDWSDTDKTKRELRGGSWDLKPTFARISNHNSIEPQARYVSIGFRCAR